jgi:hypothetical protein
LIFAEDSDFGQQEYLCCLDRIFKQGDHYSQVSGDHFGMLKGFGSGEISIILNEVKPVFQWRNDRLNGANARVYWQLYYHRL